MQRIVRETQRAHHGLSGDNRHAGKQAEAYLGATSERRRGPRKRAEPPDGWPVLAARAVVPDERAALAWWFSIPRARRCHARARPSCQPGPVGAPHVFVPSDRSSSSRSSSTSAGSNRPARTRPSRCSTG